MRALVLAALLTLMQGATSSSNTAGTPESGLVEKGTYGNSYFGLSYRPPQQLKINTDEYKRESKAGEQDKNRDKSYVLLSAHEVTAKIKVRDGVVLVADDAANYGGLKDGSEYLRRMTRFYKSEGADVLHDSTPVTFAGHPFFRGDYRRAGLRQATYMTAIATVRRGYALCFIFTSGSPEGIESLVGSLQTLAFSGDNHDPPK